MRQQLDRINIIRKALSASWHKGKATSREKIYSLREWFQQGWAALASDGKGRKRCVALVLAGLLGSATLFESLTLAAGGPGSQPLLAWSLAGGMDGRSNLLALTAPRQTTGQMKRQRDVAVAREKDKTAGENNRNRLAQVRSESRPTPAQPAQPTAVGAWQEKRTSWTPSPGVTGKKVAVAPAQRSPYVVPVSWQDIRLLAHMVQGEARGEPFIGKVAVAAVVVNRLQHPRFPRTVAGIIYNPGEFSSVSDGQINIAPDGEAYRAVLAALKGWDPTGGALYFYNPAKSTSRWIYSRPVYVRYGEHVFAG